MNESEGAPGRPDPAAGEHDVPRAGPGTPTVPCDLCGAPVLERHCKIVCRNCGYMRDCSDP